MTKIREMYSHTRAFYSDLEDAQLLWEMLKMEIRAATIAYSGTSPRPKAAGVEPHTHTKRRAGNFLWSWQAEWLVGACAVRAYIRCIS